MKHQVLTFLMLAIFFLKVNSQTDACLSQPCLNEGTCTASQDKYTCKCKVGFKGAKCGIDIDECAEYPCMNGGSCVNTKGSYTCNCLSDYTGINCETYINACADQPCANFGECVSLGGKFKCICLPGWTGVTCKTDINECAKSPCLNNGKCSNNPGSFSCKCSKGWTGFTCNEKVDPCLSSPCFNGGKCTNEGDSFNCSCVKGFKGKLCKKDIDECSTNPCGKGTCVNSYGSYKCFCPGDKFGDSCQYSSRILETPDFCANEPCKNGGTCKLVSSKFVCVCAPGWSGILCESPFTAEACWRVSYGRDIGRVPNTCPPGHERNGALCYPLCESGYFGNGPVCWEMCPQGFIDDGITCRKPLHIYQKGCCCILGNCCKHCAPGYTDDGCTCRKPDEIFSKKTKTRKEIFLQCDSSVEVYDAGLCYKPCEQDFYGIGPVCWKKCTVNLPYDCGAMCTANRDKCIQMTNMQVLAPFALAGGIGLLATGNNFGVELISMGVGFLKAGYILQC